MPKVALVTKHEKARWIAPYLAPIGYHVIESGEFDTDVLGTFSGELERTLLPMDAALTKAKKACELAELDWGLGSEGSFGGGPAPGIVNWNSELLCLYQASTDRALYAHAAGPTSLQKLAFDDRATLMQKLDKFPNQYWIVRSAQGLAKGLSAEQLLDKLDHSEILAHTVQVEPDLRAMNCPERQKMIIRAAEDLVRRLSETCPVCRAFNFVVKDKETGLPCDLCTMPTEQAKSWICICDDCGHRDEKRVEQLSADPTYCQFCNP